MGKSLKRVVAARTKEDRKKVRKELGSLKSLTVQPVTKTRYQASLKQFFDYLGREGLTLPKTRDKLDPLVSDYLEQLWAEGEGRAMASTFLAALQDFDPKLKGCLPCSWRLMKTWTINEAPNRAPPLTLMAVKAMAGWAWLHDHHGFGLGLLVGFFGLLRTGELLSLQAWQIHMSSAVQPAVIALGLTKSGKRQGAAESVTITELFLLKLLWQWKKTAKPHDFLTEKPHEWRQRFQECLEALKLSDWGFRPYSLRRGGATAMFVKCGSLDRVLLAGRWSAVKTAKIYLNSGLAMLADLKIGDKKLQPFLTHFSNSLRLPPKLEPVLEKNRSGGRGRDSKRSKRVKKGEGEV